ncbi:MAG: hypothetical protein IH620_04225 [Ignavibacterium sp.]|nr:hypothetical protein [Ignavibacterium sp.]
MKERKKKYYLGGYYLTKLRPKNYGTETGSLIYTCSECINDNLVETWAYSWTVNNDKQAKEAKENFQLTDTQIKSIRTWVDNKHNESKLGWINVFTELTTALEYKNNFFSHLIDIKLMALYFDEDERADILDVFKPQKEKNGEIGLRLTLLKEFEERDNEIFLGYDYIGIENGGSFHTFHCHDIGKELSDKFGLILNKYGLFESDVNSKQVLDYLNDENNGIEPVPWFIAKTKLVTNE